MSNRTRAKVSSKASISKNQKRLQKGGGSTDYAGLFYAPYADNHSLTSFGLKYVDQSPMFNPLETGTIFATPTSGVIPTGSYYDAIAPLTLENSIGPPVAQGLQLGGANGEVYYTTKTGKKITNPWIAHVFKFAEKHNTTYPKALKHPDIKKGYKKISK